MTNIRVCHFRGQSQINYGLPSWASSLALPAAMLSYTDTPGKDRGAQSLNLQETESSSSWAFRWNRSSLWPTTELQSHGRPWFRASQLSNAQIPDPQTTMTENGLVVLFKLLNFATECKITNIRPPNIGQTGKKGDNGQRVWVSLWGNETVLKLTVMTAAQLGEHTQNPEFYT